MNYPHVRNAQVEAVTTRTAEFAIIRRRRLSTEDALVTLENQLSDSSDGQHEPFQSLLTVNI